MFTLNRDRVAILPVRPEESLTFRDLYTRGRAVLRFGCGVAFPRKPGEEDGPVRFRIEITNTGEGRTGASEPMCTLFDRTLSMADLPEESLYLPFELDCLERMKPDGRCDLTAYTMKPQFLRKVKRKSCTRFIEAPTVEVKKTLSDLFLRLKAVGCGLWAVGCGRSPRYASIHELAGLDCAHTEL